MNCRPGCGACCIAISISTPIPGLGRGKKAGEKCPHLDEDFLCKLFGKPERPAICSEFRAAEWICGSSAGEAFRLIEELENLTGGKE